MATKDSEDHTKCYQFTENSSNIIPSSELDPPPPVVCHLQPCRSSDLCIGDSETLNSQSAALVGTFESSLDDSRSPDGNHRQRTFTQADDYQDISKENAVVPQESKDSSGILFWSTLHPTVVSAGDSEDSIGYSAYRLVNSATENEIVNSDVECAAKPVSDSSAAEDKPMLSYPSLSDLPVMSQIERVDLVWDAQNTCDVTQPRGSTPVALSFMGKKSLKSTDRFTSSGVRASEPIGTPKTVGADVFEITPIARGGSVTSPATALEDLSTSESAVVSSVDEQLPTNPVDSRSDSKDEPVPTTSTGTPSEATRSCGPLVGTNSSSLVAQNFSVHLSILATPVRSSSGQKTPVFLDGFDVQVAEDDRLRSGGLLIGEFNALWSRLHSFLLSSLYPECTDSATCSELISQRNSESSTNWNPPHTSSNPCNVGRIDNILPVGTSARASSSSSDLFIPRPERMHFKRQPSRMFPLHPANFRSSTSSSDHSIRRMRPPRIPLLQKESKRPAVFSSPSAPDSSPHVSGCSSGSSGTVQSPAVNVTSKSVPVNQSPVTTYEVSKSSEPTRLSQALIYQPSLTLVPETPSEESDERASLSNACAIVPESTSASMSDRVSSADDGTHSSGLGESTMVPEPVSEINEVSPTKAVLVYGKWHPEPYYYAGLLELPQSGFRLLVHFDDGSKASLRPADILYVNLLPIKAEVYADWSNSGEFWADCVIEAHLMDSRLPYLVHCRTNGERKALGRKDVSIHHSQVTLLRSMGQLPESTTVAFRKNNSPAEKRATRSADRPQSKSLLCSPDVSLANVLFGKRQAKVKRYRTSWVTPVTRLAAAEGQAGRRECASDTDHSRSSKPLSSPLCTFRDLSDRRTSVKQSKRTHGCATPPTQSKDSNVVSKKQRMDETMIQKSPVCLKPIEEHTNLHDTPTRKSLDACVLPLPPDSSTSLFLRRSLSRTLGIPTPGPRVFSGWTLILTGHIQSSEAVGSSDVVVDRSTLEQLVLACGGHIANQLSPRTFQTTSGSPVWGSEQHLSLSHATTHIALVAPGCCRTLKYFQALATLGRVPMLHTDWILDACREEANSASDENVKPGTHIDWPLRLLMTRPGRYELPRGYNSSTKELVNWYVISMCAAPNLLAILIYSFFSVASTEAQSRLLIVGKNDETNSLSSSILNSHSQPGCKLLSDRCKLQLVRVDSSLPNLK
ncbi:hypothetical protein P879_04443 [Paragonimus westermani]|uniref:BRCT domain-containing protein n=1 Tax=Paragonimus westermani TaxID=34504 RepID=A0A8T0DB61_9TREM|nr:hypothetical protein P879_04443 [Paragonimus westermani]